MAWSSPTEWERWDPDKVLICPYDQMHRIPAKRYQYHIIKCREGEIEPYSFKGSEKDSEGFYFKGDTSVPCYRKEECSIPPDDDWDIGTVVTIISH
ncbi:hypothetical protein QZH41_010284 [Actinostola sp. cb2023]|nr:hypothetical protein QZH41_010284 [Actinostola sp. cb2023]